MFPGSTERNTRNYGSPRLSNVFFLTLISKFHKEYKFIRRVFVTIFLANCLCLIIGGYKMQDRGPVQMKGKGTINTYFLYGKEGFTKPLPDENWAAGIHEHEFK